MSDENISKADATSDVSKVEQSVDETAGMTERGEKG
jgi:hypothetical protein